MKNVAKLLVERRRWIFAFVLAATVICGLLIPRVGLTADMSGYLPDDSKMKIGTDLMN